MSNNPLED